MRTNKIAIVGLGKLGLPLLTTFAKNEQKIIGFDIDEKKITQLKKGEVPFFEPNLQELYNENINNIEVENNTDKLISQTDVAIILVNTPSKPDGTFSNEYIFQSVESISKSLKNSDTEEFLFIISSTVMPRTHLEIIKLIEFHSGRKLNSGFGLLYIPDLVALGNVIYDFENPDVLIMGQSSEKFGTLGEEIYRKIIKNNAPIVRMSLVEAEISKVSLNAYITMKISFANFIGNIAEKLNCNPKNITKALGYDKRISPYYLSSGLSFGGTCFPRDTWAFITMSEKLGLDAEHIVATQRINEKQNEILINKVGIYKDKIIGVFGLSFKPKTSVTTESASFILYEFLKNNNYNVLGCDDLVETDYTLNTFDEFLNRSEVVVLAHINNKLFERYKDVLQKKILIDPWHILS